MVLAAALPLQADWTETNNDGGPGGLDQPGWVAAYNGSAPGPATNWHTAANLAAAGWGTDPGWTGNVVAITDADATAYAAANQVLPDFWRARAEVAVSTQDPDEEFGAMVRASQFNMDDPPTAVTAYAATFNFNNAVGVGDPMEFKLYKIVNGVPTAELTAHPLVPASFDDFIVAIKLEAVGRHIRARLYDDTGDAVPLADLSLYDYDYLPAGDTGVTALDYDATVGIGALYDTLVASTPTAGLTGDFTGDDLIGLGDVEYVQSAICDAMGPGGYDIALDFDGDGDNDEDDVIFYIRNFPERPTGMGTEVGDLNLDGFINATDLAILAEFFGSSGVGYGRGNLNCDDFVNATDLAILAGNFGYAAPEGAAVPEPATLGLLAAGAAFVIRRRKRSHNGS
jgi:hypothetical protein